MSCDHCLRGHAENRNIDINLFQQFIRLNKIDSIGNLNITGGEPFMNPKAIIRIAHVMYEQGISLGGFFLATNGTVFSYSVIESLSMLKEMVDEDEMFMLMISEDEFHNKDMKRHPVWSLLNPGKKETKRQYVIAEGFGKDINPNGRLVHNQMWTWDDGDIIEGMIYINALGMVCKECDYSYKSQQYRNIGHCLDRKLIDMEDNDYDNSEDL